MGQPRFEKLDPVQHDRDRFPDRIRHQMMIEVDAADDAAVAEFRPHHPGRDADHGDFGRRAVDHDRVCADPRASSDGDGPKNFRAGADDDAIFQRRMALARRPGRAAQRHAVIQRDIVADLGGLADHDAGAMIDEEALADLRRRMDVDIGQKTAEPGQQPGRELPVGLSTDDGRCDARSAHGRPDR